ncbi:MAG: type I asparaginase [Bacteroidales bacterium]|nr:type I asparaginase [Bacteroidales bacterium]
MESKTSILVIYTGGTIGMINDLETGMLLPYDFELISKHIPEINNFDYDIDSYSFDPPIDSSNMKPDLCVKLATVIEDNYENYDGFVVLHGSDTMAFTASALSFMLENLNKPVIFTGSQLPIGIIRTDGKENFITSIEIAAAKDNDLPIVPEVCIYFENQLYRANRTHKYNAVNFKAFSSLNYPVLAEAGVYIKYNKTAIHKPNFKKLLVHKIFDTNIAILKLFPGIQENTVNSILNIKGLRAVILETYGSGNAPTDQWFIEALSEAIKKGIIIVNVTQCKGGAVELGKYQTSLDLNKIGIISGHDITSESAIVKTMLLLGSNFSEQKLRKLLEISIRGEITL